MTVESRNRDAGLDALRAAVTLLVVFHHAALTYGAIGGWFYREVPAGIRPDTALLVLFCTVNQAWFMGLFFLIAGYLTPPSVARHGRLGYARERLLRLGLPLLAFGLVIGPLTIALAQTARGHPVGATLRWLWAHRHFENGPLWFAQALLLFGGAYLLLNWRPRALPFPSDRALVAAWLVTGCGAFALRLAWPVGTTVLGLQAGYFASYIVLFAAGCLGAGGGWLAAVPRDQRRRWLVVAALALPVFPAVARLVPGDSSGGLTVPAAVYAFWEPLVAWGTILGMLDWFGRSFQSLGPVWSRLSRRAYAIFIIHPPVLVAVAMAWNAVAAPPLLKFAITGSIACALCYGIAGLLVGAPGLRHLI